MLPISRFQESRISRRRIHTGTEPKEFADTCLDSVWNPELVHRLRSTDQTLNPLELALLGGCVA